MEKMLYRQIELGFSNSGFNISTIILQMSKHFDLKKKIGHIGAHFLCIWKVRARNKSKQKEDAKA